MEASETVKRFDCWVKVKARAYPVRNYISLMDLVGAAQLPAGIDCQIVAFEYTTPEGWQFLSRLKMLRQIDQKLIAVCPACGEMTAVFGHHPAGRGLRCIECLERLERTERKQNIKV